MNQWILRLFSLSVLTGLLLAGCQSQTESLVPVTGAKEVALAQPAELARDNVLQYIHSSSRLASLPPSTDWQLETWEQPSGEYRFRNGDWLMLVRLPDARRVHEQVILINEVAQISWSGYIGPDGQVVDTSFGR